VLIINLDLAEFAVEYAQKLGATYAEARLEQTNGHSVILKNSTPETLGIVFEYGIGIRVIHSGGLAFSSVNTISKDHIKDAVEKAVKFAKQSGKARKEPIRFSEEKSYDDSYEVKMKKSFLDISNDERLKLLLDLDEMILSRKSDVLFPARIFMFTDWINEKYFVNSDGTKIYSNLPRFSLIGVITAIGNNRAEQTFEQYGETGGWEKLEALNIPDRLSDSLSALEEQILKSKPCPEGEMDLVIGPEVAGIIAHESAGHPGEADRILGREGAQAGESYLSPEDIGIKIGSENVSVIDDPTLDGSYGYYLYDDEGVRARARYLIKNGIITEFLHNRETAATMGTHSNGAARGIGFNREPIVRMANTFIAPGDWDPDEIIEEVKFGILMETFGEWNIDDRRFNQKYIGRKAYLIENGEIKHPVNRPVLEITTPGFYSSVVGSSKKLDFVAATCGKSDPSQGAPVWTGGPERTLVRGIRIGGSS